MANQTNTIMKNHKRQSVQNEKIWLRKHLNADALFATMHTGFSKIKDHRSSKVQHTLADALMSHFTMFSLKDPS